VTISDKDKDEVRTAYEKACQERAGNDRRLKKKNETEKMKKTD